MSTIRWPERYLPGTTDFFVSNETVAVGLEAIDVWPFLANTSRWRDCYGDVSDICFHDGRGPELHLGARFQFAVGDSLVQAEVTEYVPPTAEEPGRLAWHGWVSNAEEIVLDAHCAWLVENLSGRRVRIVWQESLIGEPAKNLAGIKPNPALNSHQDWVDGVATASVCAKRISR